MDVATMAHEKNVKRLVEYVIQNKDEKLIIYFCVPLAIQILIGTRTIGEKSIFLLIFHLS